jgi:alkylation response protein AidB-like acyl-CoA dehydrogenase
VPARPGEELRWRASARTFAEAVLAPLGPAIDRTDEVPPVVFDGLRTGGFLGIGLPEAWGGAPAPVSAVAGVLEELAQANAAVATMLSVHLAVAAAPIAQFGTEDQKDRFLRPLAEGRTIGAFALTEPSAGSDAAGLRCRYERDGAGFRLTGAKTFITDADLAGVILAFATRDASLGHRGISAFLVTPDTPGFQVARKLPKLGLHGSTTTELVFDRALLGPDRLLGPEGEGFRVAMDALAGGRIGIAACALGTARAAYEALRSSAKADPEDWKRVAVARAFVEVESAAALVREAARAKDAGEPFIVLASAAKLAASRAAVNIASRGMEVAGPGSAVSGSRWERLLRDARVFPIVEGTTEIQELILGRGLLGP